MKIQLTKIGSEALKALRAEQYGSDQNIWEHGTLLREKHEAQCTPVSEFMEISGISLPEWDGDIRERAAVALGFRKKNAQKLIAGVVTD